ncbi:MAG: chemotaxis protein [Inquilinus sp.]|nr:chemotaxis protein [Inquilinus sp.]
MDTRQSDAPPADRDEDLVACIDAVIGGDLIIRPRGDDPLSRKLSLLFDRMAADTTAALDHAVTQSMAANELSVSGGQMLRMARDVDGQTQSIASAITEMVSSVETLSSSTDDVAEYVEGVTQATIAGERAVENAGATMQQISSAVGEAAGQVDALKGASSQIGDIVKSIEEIAAQTKLLALNATIEAARAGEAGKGFGVVASEVKSLSEQTARATQDIRDRITALQEEMGAIVGSMTSGAKAVESGLSAMETVGSGMNEIAGGIGGVKSRIEEVATVLRQQAAASNEIASGATAITTMTQQTVAGIEANADTVDRSISATTAHAGTLSNYEVPGKIVRLAKADHVIWKKRLADMLVGRAKLRDSELADHRSCRLGKWYYSDLAEAFRGSAAFAALEGPHEQVHTHGKEAARLYNAGDLDGAISEIAEVEAASKEVLAKLDQLLIDCPGR